MNRRRLSFVFSSLISAVLLFVLVDASWAEEEKVEPLKVLLVTGGSSHDYDNQKLILTEGIVARANVEWTIAHQGGKDRNQKIELFQKSNWADGYDVVVHNQCFGGVVDVPFVEGIARVHAEGVPAVMIHCTPHSYRNAKTDAWRKVVGVSSFSHEKHRPLEVKNLAADHPVMQGFPRELENAQRRTLQDRQTLAGRDAAGQGLWQGYSERPRLHLDQHA